MKIFGFTTTLVLALILTSCVSPVTMTQVIGAGSSTTIEHDLAGFSRVRASSAFDVTIKQGKDYSVVLTVDEAVKPYLDVRVNGDTLNIGLKPNTTLKVGSKRLHADVTMPAIKGLDFSGASRGTISGFESPADLSVTASGASSIEGTLTTGDVSSVLSGASKLVLKGQGGDLKLEASGASNANLSDFSVGDANVRLSGASHADVKMNGKLDADVSGASNLTYSGAVRLGKVQNSGASRVEKR